MAVIIVLHVIACVLLIVLILIQRGRGGGLVESFSGVESMFGTKTSVFLTRFTTILSIIFFCTCLSLALLSARQSRSLMRSAKPEAAKSEASKPEVPAEATTSTSEPAAAPVEPQPQAPAAPGTPTSQPQTPQ